MLRGVSVVVIDSDPASLKLAALLLRGEGAMVTTAQSAEQALREVEAVRPDVVVVDLQLPAVSGTTLARVIRQFDWAKNTVIACLSSGNGRLRQDALDSGCGIYLEKPLDERLVDEVVRALGARR